MWSKNQRPATPLEHAHLGRIKGMQCICCYLLGRQQSSPTDAHHIRQGGQERNHWLTIPLCHDDCHQGPNGVEHNRVYLRILKMSEWDLLAATMELIAMEEA